MDRWNYYLLLRNFWLWYQIESKMLHHSRSPPPNYLNFLAANKQPAAFFKCRCFCSRTLTNYLPICVLKQQQCNSSHMSDLRTNIIDPFSAQFKLEFECHHLLWNIFICSTKRINSRTTSESLVFKLKTLS